MKKKRGNIWPWVIGGLTVAGLIALFNRGRVLKQLRKVLLSKNFNLAEFVATSTGVENIPPPEAIENLRKLVVYCLQPLRDALVRRNPGKKVVIIPSSGYRSPGVNAIVPGSSKTSQHPKGEAADYSVFVDGKKLSNQEVIDIIREEGIPYDQLIDEQRGNSLWIHHSYSHGKNRAQWMTRRDPGPGREREYETIKVG